MSAAARKGTQARGAGAVCGGRACRTVVVAAVSAAPGNLPAGWPAP